MGFLSDRYNKPGPGIPKNIPQKKGVKLFFEIFFREFFELIKLNLIFVLFCIPVVTIPAACTAMSKITLTMIRDQNHFLWTDFVKAFKADFKKSTLAGLIVFGGILASMYGLYFYASATRTNNLFYVPLGISGMLLLILTLMSYYIFPMIALVELPFKQVFKNAFLLSFICFAHNLAALAVTGVLLVLFIGFLPLTLPVMIFFFFAPINLITTFAAYAGMRKYVIAAESEA